MQFTVIRAVDPNNVVMNKAAASNRMPWCGGKSKYSLPIAPAPASIMASEVNRKIAANRL
jgi:hypothetical protein